MADRDVSNPGDSDVISAYPANERAQRSAQSTIFNVDHYDPDDADQGNHRQVHLKALGSDPLAASLYATLYTKEVNSITELFLIDSAGTVLQLTNAGGINNEVVNMPAQASTPTTPVDSGNLYTQDFNGQPELFWQDEAGNVVRLTFQGQLAVDLSTTDLIVGSLRTNNFFRGRRRTVSSTAGVLDFDFETATVFEITITENTVGTLTNMPSSSDGEEQTMLIDITNGGNFTTALASTYSLIRPGGVIKAFTANGRDLVVLSTHDGSNIMMETALDFS